MAKKDEYGRRGQGTRAIDGSKPTMWIFEPHVAEKIFEDYIIEIRIKFYNDEWLNRDNGVVKKDNKIISMMVNTVEDPNHDPNLYSEIDISS